MCARARIIVEAVVYDANGNKVAYNTVVTFTIETGTATITTTGKTLAVRRSLCHILPVPLSVLSRCRV